MMRKRIFSGVQPTGNIHLGNYLGALRNWVALQTEYESFFCIVNLHAITNAQDPKTLAEKTRELARIYLAVGIDPNVSTIFVQSDVSEHSQLTWLLNCITRMSELERMTQFKEKARKQQENVGVRLFDYPVLMASDILLYQTDLVPVGEDQKQHLELTRDIGARIMSLADPTKKMSKSDEETEAGCIMLLDDADAVRRKFKRAVTDSGTEIRFDSTRPAINNLLTIYQLLTQKSPEEIEGHFAGKGYAQLKAELADVTIEFLQPFQERVRGIDDDKLDAILGQGAEKAAAIARATLSHAQKNMGLIGACN
ncbi:MAG: tryptophan--tRNA ligase [Acidobacteria bacterium]|nr:MAG: tryptophan--tRNA ligase [Acidobacteriota bacterium]